jgi:hypothetical protein
MATVHLYTFIFEFRGGTYISQTLASSLLEAILGWIRVPPNPIWSHKLSQTELETFIEDRSPVALDGAVGVWCISGTINGHFALLNIVDTLPV